jgi:hypothetical protein
VALAMALALAGQQLSSCSRIHARIEVAHMVSLKQQHEQQTT